MDMLPLISSGLVMLAVSLLYMTAWWVASVLLERTDVADVAWGLGFVTLAWWSTAVVSTTPFESRSVVVSMLVTVWGVRLAWHIGQRNFAAGRGEDERYAEMRRRSRGTWAARSLVAVFWLQGVLMWLVASPMVVLTAAADRALMAVDLLAVAVWCIGFTMESLGDAQLHAWLADPAHRGKPLDTGVWAWTRHPNYFGDALEWWAIGLLALPSRFWFAALVGPLVMTLLLRFVSGVPPLELRHVGEPDWEAYRERTPVFFPRPPERRRRPSA